MTQPYRRDDFIVAPTAYGKAVFANRPFRKGERLLTYRGEIVTTAELPEPYDKENSHYMQVGPDRYLSPSGGLDDLVNHSCEPNAGLRFKRAICLVALRDIAPCEEITFDYSTVLDEDDWELDCLCGTPACRGRVRDFKHLPRGLQEKYARLGIVPGYALSSAGLSGRRSRSTSR